MKISRTSTQRPCAYFSLQNLDKEVEADTSARSLGCASRLSFCPRIRKSRSHLNSPIVSEPTFNGRSTRLHVLSTEGSLPSTSSEHSYSMCRKDDQTLFCNCWTSYKFITHRLSRNHCNSTPHQDLDHKVYSENGRTISRNECCYSKWIQLYPTTYSTIFGLLNGLFMSPWKHSHGGITRIICLTILFTYLCLPLSQAAPRHKLRRLQTNYSGATEMNALLTLLRQLDEKTSASVRGGPSSRGSSYDRRPTRSGRSGRRRVTESPPLEPDVVASLIKEEFHNASCKPRDTILDAFKETNIDRGYNLLVPECIVVKRCQNGGCCMEHQECTSSGSEYKTFYFWHNQQMITKAIRQDTSCICQDKSPYCSLTQDNCTNGMILDSNQCKCVCQQRCPKPFLQIDTCECDCLMSDKPCKNFFRGKRGLTLSNSECNCVQRGECLQPPCANGHFSKHHCRCINPTS